jgi:C4-dicarboxylate-specific signal transduction histidine kinase
LLQVFLNLSANSLRATRRGGAIRLTVNSRTEDDQVIICFQDEGPGVDDVSQLFQPFRENADGSGLGLYVSRAMMRGFDGDLRYVPVPQGCRFDVVLRAFRGEK